MLKNYLKSSFQELTKVTWPTKNQAVKLTIIVLIFCIIVALFLGVIDYLFNRGYNYLLQVAGQKAPAVEEVSTEAIPELDLSGIEIEGDGDFTVTPVETPAEGDLIEVGGVEIGGESTDNPTE